MNKLISTRPVSAAMALTATICAGAFAGGTTHAAEAPKGWETVASAGVTLTRGNSETFLGTVGINSSRKWSKDEILLGATAGYGENTSTDPVDGSDEHNTTDQFAKAFGQWNHLFSEKFYGGVRADGLYDAIAGVDYRFTVSPLAGYYLIKNAKTFLAVEAGPGFVAENLAHRDADQYVTLRLAERFEHKFTDRAKIWESVEYMPRIDDFGDYVLNAEVGVSAGITEHVDLRAVLQDTYRSEPPAGRKNNDLKLIVGVGYKF
jgi:putative salt-induced outer membrane protein YdiY